MRLRYELRRLLTAFLVVGLSCGVLTAGVYGVYALFAAYGLTNPASYWFYDLHPSFRALFGVLSALDMSDPLAFFSRFYIPVLMLASFGVIVTAARSMNSDADMEELLYMQPVSRASVYWRRFGGGMLFVVLLNLLQLVIAVVGIMPIVNVTLPYLIAYAVIFLRITVYECVLWSVGMLLSVCIRKSRASAWCGVAVTALSWAAPILPAFTGLLAFLWYLAPSTYAFPEYALLVGPNYTLPQGIVLGVIFILCTLTGWLIYSRRETTAE